jgi:iron complex transport system substrate-binding protein
MIRRHLAAAGAVLLVLAACSPDTPASNGAASDGAASHTPTGETVSGDGISLVDAAGRRLTLEAPPLRIVALVPAANDILLALGDTARLVGRTNFDTLPALQHLPSVGGGLGPDLEVLSTLAPDLVIRFEGSSDTTTPARLDELGIAHLAVRPDQIADVFDMITWLGRVTGRTERAEALASDLRAQLDAVREQTRNQPPVRAVFLMGGTPPWTAGPGTFIDELITLAGGVNALADLPELYAAVNPEVLATRAIDVVLTAPGVELDERITRQRRVARVTSDVVIPGPSLGRAARDVAKALHPGLNLVDLQEPPQP